MKALVTGAAGFIGSHLVDALAARGDEVIALDIRNTPEQKLAEMAGARIVNGEVIALSEVIEGDLDVVFHLAALTGVEGSSEDPILNGNVNVCGTIAACEIARKTNARLVLASTAAVYGEPHMVPTSEGTPLTPTSPYGASKVAAEAYCGAYWRQHNLPVAILRLADVYGPRQKPHGHEGVVAIFSNYKVKDLPATVHGDGYQTRDYVFVGDVVKAFIMAADLQVLGPMNIGSGEETSVNDLADALDLERVCDMTRNGGVRRSCLDPTTAQETLGWYPEVSLADGLEATLDWWRLQ